MAKKKKLDKPKVKRPRGQLLYEKSQKDKNVIIALRAVGYTQQQVADVLGMHIQTMKKYYPKEVKESKLNYEVMAVSNVLNGVKKADKFYTKLYLMTQCGWNETKNINNTGEPVVVASSPEKTARNMADLILAEYVNDLA